MRASTPDSFSLGDSVGITEDGRGTAATSSEEALSEDSLASHEGAGGGAGKGANGGRETAAAQAPRAKGPRRAAVQQGVVNGKPPGRVPPVMLLLAGLPGSGKSTFSRGLLDKSAVSWVHINQDAISNGRPGKREQCLASARLALTSGSCCVVDRCHLDASQRSDFVALAAALRVPCHCLAVMLPAATCAQRVADREEHPGGVKGPKMKAVVHRKAGELAKSTDPWPPPEAEGFASAMDCRTDADVAAALRAWALYGMDEQGAGAGGTAGDVVEGAAVAAAAAAGSAGPGVGGPVAATLAAWRAHAAGRKEPAAATGIQAFFKPAAAGGTGKAGTAGVGAGKAPAAGAKGPQAAVPAAGVAGSGSSGTKAAALAGGARSAAAGKRGAAAAGVASQHGAGPHAKRPALNQGAAAPGQTPAKVLAQSQEGIRPSVDGAWPSPDTKASVRHTGATAEGPTAGAALPPAHGSQPLQGGGGSEAGPGSPGASPGRGQASTGARPNAFAVLMGAAKAQGAKATGGGAGAGGGGSAAAGTQGKQGKAAAPAGAAASSDAPDPRFALTGAWAQALRTAALVPDAAGDAILYQDEQVVLMRDKFPKARCHALVVARDPGLRSIADLRAPQHMGLLTHMRRVGEDWARARRAEDPSLCRFKLGFHAVPSMCQLHMHVVTQDFDSPCLKHKKHWNSFTTAFFIPVDELERQLREGGRVALVSPERERELEGAALRCHACGRAAKTMPELKAHIATCATVTELPGI